MIGIQEENGDIKLNPGSLYTMKLTDTCFYMSLAKEENSSLLIAEAAKISIPDEEFSMSSQLTRHLPYRRKSIAYKSGNNYQNQSNGNYFNTIY